MTLKNILLTSALMLLASLAWAHGSHNHSVISIDQAHQVAANISEQFTQKDAGLSFGVLPKSWAKIAPNKITTHKKAQDYYIIALNNDQEGKILYVLMNTQGKVYDANFSGTFEGLN